MTLRDLGFLTLGSILGSLGTGIAIVLAALHLAEVNSTYQPEAVNGEVMILRTTDYTPTDPSDPLGEARLVVMEQTVVVTEDGDIIPMDDPEVVQDEMCPPVDDNTFSYDDFSYESL